MKRYMTLIMLMLALVLTSCGSKPEEVEDTIEYEETTGIVKIGELKVESEADFKVEHLVNGFKMITDGVGRKLLLVPEGEELNSDLLVPGWEELGYDIEKLDDVVVIKQPVKSIGVSSTAHIEWLKAIGEEDSIVDLNEMTVVEEPELIVVEDFIEDILELGSDNSIVFSNEREGNDVARLEWVKLFGTIFNKDTAAREYFESETKK